MSIKNFKPEVWSKVLLGSLPMRLVYGGDLVINRDYEGDIAETGDTVHITSIADPVVSDYEIDQDINYQNASDAGQSFQIQQAKYWAVRIDDIDKRQAAGQIAPFMRDKAAYSIAVAVDQYIASKYTGVAAGNVIGSAGSPITPQVFQSITSHPADFLTQVVIPGQIQLDEADVPDDGSRYMIVPPWGRGLVEMSAGFAAGQTANGDTGAVMQRGFMGSLLNMNVMVSRNNPTPVAGPPGTAVSAIQFGHRSAITYADQLVETEAMRSEKAFKDIMRGLHLFDCKVVRPEALAVAYVLRPVGI